MNVSKLSPFAIGYKLPLSKKVIEIPEKCRNKSIAVACTAAAETFGGLGLTAAGIAAKDPVMALSGASVFGMVAGQLAMLKGSIWDFAGKLYKKQFEKAFSEIKFNCPNLPEKEINKLADIKATMALDKA